MSQLVNAEVISGNRIKSGTRIKLRYKDSWMSCCIAGINYGNAHNVIYLTRKTITLHTHSDSFQYAKQCKGGRVPSFGGFMWLPIDTKKRPVFLPRTFIFFSSRRILAE